MVTDSASIFTPREADDLLSTRQIAEMLNINMRSVELWCSAGKLAYRRISGRSYIIRWGDFVEFWENHKSPLKQQLLLAKHLEK